MTTLATVETHDSFELRASNIALAVFHIVASIDRLRFASIFAYFAARHTRHIGTGRFIVGEIASRHFDNSGLK
jgi:hypothetical protein